MEQANAQPAAGVPATADSDSTTSGLWVFGYGSLCWHPGFDFRRSLTGFVKGYTRKFWQGNTTHRGTENQPGRVATLVEERDGVVWGRAFEVSGEAALPYLANRECKLGGYITRFATFFPKRPCGDEVMPLPSQPFPALLYVATASNRLWLGDAPLGNIATQIVESSGSTGHNAEYLLRLAEYMRSAAPEADDDHLFALEALVRDQIRERRLCLDTLMGVRKAEASATPATVLHDMADDDTPDEEGDDGGEEVRARKAAAEPAAHHHNHHHHHQEPQQQAQAGGADAFTSRVPNKKLRCVNI